VKITVRDVKYHRNGVMGVGFHAVRFKAEGRELLAVVFTDDDKPARFYAVISLDDEGKPAINERWRGDVSIDALEQAIRAADVEEVHAR
jgi:hypothetical protein